MKYKVGDIVLIKYGNVSISKRINTITIYNEFINIYNAGSHQVFSDNEIICKYNKLAEVLYE